MSLQLNLIKIQLYFVIVINFLSYTTLMNKRFVIVGIILASIITIAFFMGSPMFYGIDMSY